MKDRLLIVADLGMLKAYHLEFRDEGSPRMTLIEQLALEAGQQHTANQITDSAGRRAAPAGRMGGATMADAHNLELETKRRGVRLIAQKIESLLASVTPNGCWLAAQKEILRPVVDSIPQALRPRIEMQVPHDLTKLDTKQVMEHFLAERAQPERPR
jgi:hypothetical protein